MPRTSLPSFAALDVMLDEALHLAERGELLCRRTQPEIQAMRLWICHQVRHQAAGGRSVAWPSLAAALPPRRVLPELDWDPAEVSEATRALVAADDANRILAVSRPALELLGYDDARSWSVAGWSRSSPSASTRPTSPASRSTSSTAAARCSAGWCGCPRCVATGPRSRSGCGSTSRAMPEGRYLFTAELFDT